MDKKLMLPEEPAALFRELDKLHTTELGAERIRRNLGLTDADAVAYCRDRILDGACRIERRGKNWYCESGGIRITVNSYSYTIITAHRTG